MARKCTNIELFQQSGSTKTVVAIWQFKTKVYAKDTKDAEVINVAPDIDLEKAQSQTDAHGGLADAGLGGRDGRHQDEFAAPAVAG